MQKANICVLKGSGVSALSHSTFPYPLSLWFLLKQELVTLNTLSMGHDDILHLPSTFMMQRTILDLLLGYVS